MSYNSSLYGNEENDYNWIDWKTIIINSILIVISLIVNITMLYHLMKRRSGMTSTMNIMLIHLGLADLMVTFFLMPSEIGWAYTEKWEANAFTCCSVSFLKNFGLFLSSNVVICISIDRLCGVLIPSKKDYRARVMLVIAWICSIISSIQQAYAFRSEEYYAEQGHYYCVKYYSIERYIADVCGKYVFPLICFVCCYGAIYLIIYPKYQRGLRNQGRSNSRSNINTDWRTINMSLTIVLAYIICWTPYYIVSLWCWIDERWAIRTGALWIQPLFTFALVNTCLVPIVYGVFNNRKCFNNSANQHYELNNQ